MGTLYIISTPIGNLEDITLRALRILAAVPLVAAEDTRTTRRLLDHHAIRARLISYNDHNKAARIPALLAHLAEADLALVSDAGTPALSDPGEDLVVAAVSAGHAVVPVPGASALLAALVASGLDTRRFLYLGFLPRSSGERRRAFAAVSALPYTLVAYESPHRVRDTLVDARAALGNRRVAVCRELTQLHEEVVRGALDTVIERITAPRGEYTLVFEGAAESNEPGDLATAIGDVRRHVAAGISARDAVAEAAIAHGIPRRLVYDGWLHTRDMT
jgi:16S rRNA (cytidine1402-2'-O)-methyltransferase